MQPRVHVWNDQYVFIIHGCRAIASSTSSSSTYSLTAATYSLRFWHNKQNLICGERERPCRFLPLGFSFPFMKEAETGLQKKKKSPTFLITP